MQFLVEIFRNNEMMFLYESISVCIGIILLIYRKENHIWYNVSICSVCFVNSFLGGSMVFFQVYFNKVAFLMGGTLGLFITIVLSLVKKNVINYMFCFWTMLKVFLIVGNYVLKHDSPQQEKRIFILSVVLSLLFAF